MNGKAYRLIKSFAKKRLDKIITKKTCNIVSTSNYFFGVFYNKGICFDTKQQLQGEFYSKVIYLFTQLLIIILIFHLWFMLNTLSHI